MKFPSLRRLFGKLWNRNPRYQRPHRRSANGASTLRLTMEALEDRTVMSTLTPPVIADQSVLIGGAHSPQIAVDPFDPQRMVAVAGAGSLAGRFTTDGGETWSTFGIGTSGLFSSAADPSVGFDLYGHFYVAAVEYNGDIVNRSRGQVSVYTFDFTGTNPNQIDTNYVYRWDGIDAAFNTAIGVGSNTPYVDPEDNSIVVDPSTMGASLQTIGGRQVPKVVYVAWNTDWTSTGSQVLVAATPYGNNDTSGGDHPFTTVQRVSSIGGAAPQILFTQNSPNGDIPADILAIFYQNTSGSIGVDLSRPDGGVAATPVASTRLYDGNGGFIPDAFFFGNDANGNPIPDGRSEETFTITITDPGDLSAIRDMDVRVRLNSSNLSHLSIALIPPMGSSINGGFPIQLLRNRIRTDGGTNVDINNVPVGLAGGTALGTNAGNTFIHTVFDDDAPRVITTGGFAAPFAGHFRPEGIGDAGTGTNFFTFSGSGLPLSEFLGTWTLRIRDNRNDARANAPGDAFRNQLLDWEIHLTGTIVDGMGNDRIVTGSSAVLASDGSIYSVAQDRTVGDYSPYSGRIYVAATTGGAPDRNIRVATTDAITSIFGSFLTTFTDRGQVNDDRARDNFSEGNRDQYMPTIAVDRSTGTLIVTYNDARWDAANLRYTTMISSSIDGGETFATSAFLNRVKTATDFLTGDQVEIEPIPGNSGTNTMGNSALGRRNALYSYQGKVVTLYGSNVNDASSQVWTAFVRIAAGPRVVSGDMGPVQNFGTVTDDGGNTYTYNDSYSPEGVRQLTGFVVEFDRPIDPATFGIDDIVVQYRNPYTPVDQPPNATLPVGQIIVLDGNTTFGPQDVGGNGTLATRFLVLLQDPQSGIGTYSYAIGPMIRDRMRDPFGRIVPGTVASLEPLVSQINLTLPARPGGPGSSSQVDSNIVVSGLTPALLRDLTVEVSITHPSSQQIELRLFAPNGQGSILLHDDSFFGSGSNFTTTIFDGYAATDINNASPPFLGVFRPDETMETFIRGVADVNGTWTLRIRNFDNAAGTLLGWKLNLQTGRTETAAGAYGNYMDQFQNGGTADLIRENAARRISGDRFAIPNPISGVPFQLPYTIDTLPLMISGPRLEQTARNEVQTIGIVATGGTFTLSVPGFATPTAPIAFNATATTVRTALEAIGGTGNFNVLRYQTGTSRVFQVTFVGALAGRDLAPMTADGSLLTGAGASATVRTLTQGTRGVNLPGITPTNGEALAVNTNVNTLEFEFDRLVQVSTFTPADVLEIIGPYGRIDLGAGNANVTVTAVNPTNGLAKAFRVGFPMQVLSGSYSVVLGPDIQDSLGNRLDNNANAGLDVLRGTDPTSALFAIGQYSRSNLTVAVPAGQTVTVPLDIPDNFLIAQNIANQIRFTFNLNHPDVRDLTGQLISPNGTVIDLFGNLYLFAPQAGADLNNVTLTDFAQTLIQDGNPPYNTGPYKPKQPLSTFVGEQAQGQWRFRITNAGVQAGTLTSFQLLLPKIIPGTGVGETIADRGTGAFRIFIGDPSNDVVRQNWTAVGPQTNSNGHTGRVGAIAVDPSDPSGNTVFAAGANGGVWKTTNFLTSDPIGPTWIPLTDLGPTTAMTGGQPTSAMSVSHLATFGRNNDPNQTIVVASTGDTDEVSWAAGPNLFAGTNRFPGIGFMISMDGGITWKVLDSTNNANPDGSIKSINDPTRDRTFLGAKAFKVIFDPTPLSSGELILYAAVSGNAAQQGVWRSLDTGKSWTRISSAGNATDVVLAAGSAGPTGQLTILYAGIQGSGVYYTLNATSANPTLSILNGNAGNPIRRNSTNLAALPVVNPVSTPSGAKGRILLAAPAKATGVVLQDAFYQGWLYALVMTTGGDLDGLYMTKDFGANWTKVRIPVFVSGNAFPTNDESKGDVNLFRTGGNAVSSLTIDPNNPNIVYIGGTLAGRQGYTGAFIRVDTTTISDPYAVVAYDNSDPGTGPTQFTSTGPTSVGTGGAPYGILDNYNQLLPPVGDYYNMMRDPRNPFTNPSTQLFLNVTQFNNEGTDIRWTPFNDFYDATNTPSFLTIPFGHNRALAVTDQLTGKTRLIVGSFDGIYTAVDDGTGQLHTGAGAFAPVKGSRTGNLQLAQFTNGAVQPSSVAADIAGHVFYGTAVGLSQTRSGETILTDGVLDYASRFGGKEMVETDPTGSGRIFEFRWPALIDQSPFTPTDFFVITPPTGNATSLTFGLIQTGDEPATGVGQWPAFDGSVFAISPVDNRTLLVSSSLGDIFRVTPANANAAQWFEIADRTDLNSNYASALAFGAPAAYPTSNPGDVMYAGTQNGFVFATFSGGGVGTPWKPLGSPDGSTILSIQANPKASSSDIFVVTRNGVYYMADTRAAAPAWINITGNLYTITRPLFNNPAEMVPVLRQNTLTDLVADWRFAIPTPGGGTHPVLYVSGHGGVFRSIDRGVTWKYFPNADQGATQVGGYLPAVEIRDLDLAAGNNNPQTGFPDQATGLNMLVAFTYGRGAFAIKLDNSDVQQFLTIPNSGPQVASIAPISPNPGNTLTGIQVTFAGAVDPITFDANDILLLTGPTNAPVAVASVVDATPAPAPGQPNLHNIYNIFFQSTQTTPGTYTLRLGTDIRDFSGNKLNQDNDTINGEIPQDEFQGTINFTVNQAPIITGLPTSVTLQPAAQIVVPFNVADDLTPLANLMLSAVSSNQAVVQNSSIVFGGSGANRTVTIATQGPLPGTSTLTITITDHQGLSNQYMLVVNANTPPTIQPIPLVRFPHTQANQLVNPVGIDPEAPPQTLTWSLVSLNTYLPSNDAWYLDQQYRFFPDPVNFPDNAHGQNEKWMVSAVTGGPFAILPNGQLKQWNGASLASSPVIATLPTVFYTDPSLIYWAHTATNPNTVGGLNVTVNPGTGQVNLDPPATFAGIFEVTIRVTDGVQPATSSFLVHVFNSEPRFTATVPDQTMPHTDANRMVTLNATDAEGDTITFVPTLAKFTQLFDLDQQYQLSRNTTLYPDNAHGQNEKWFVGANNLLFALFPNGQFKQWNGVSLASSPVIANVPTFVYADPTLLWDAVVPPDPNTGATTVATNVAGNQLTIDPPALFAGIFRVTVAATDNTGSPGMPDSSTTSFLFNVTNNKPFLNPIADQTMSHTVANRQIPLTFGDADVTDPANFTVVLEKYTQLFDLDQQYQLTRNTTLYPDNAHGQNEKWFVGANNQLFAVFPNGQLKQWNGVSLASSPVIANVPTFVHADPTLLSEAVVPPDPNNAPTTVAANVAGGVLTIDPPFAFAGIFRVRVNLSDGMATVQQSFLFNVTNTVPTLAAIANQTMPHTQANVVVTLNGADGDADPLTYNVALAKYTQLYDLDQQYQLSRNTTLYPDNAHGQNEKWFVGANNQLFAVFANGQLKQWNGVSLASSPVIANVPTFVYADPTLLWDAVVPPDPNTPPTQVAIGVSGNQLTIDPPHLFGGIFQVTVQATDGIASAFRSFLVNVTNQRPTLAAIADRSMSHTQANLQVPLTAADGDADPLTFGVSFAKYTLLRDLDQALQLSRNTTLYPDGAHGQNEKWFVGAGNALYALLPNGQLKQWNGVSLASSPVISTVTTLAHADPTLLSDAVVPPDPNAAGNNVTGSVAGGILTIDPPAGFVGLFTTTVTVTDGIAPTARTFVVSVANQAPILAAIPNQSMPFNQDTLTVNLSATDPDGDAVTFSAQITANHLPFALDQQYGFFREDVNYYFFGNVGNGYYGFQEKWIRSATTGNYFAILPNGQLYAFSGNPVAPFGTLIATLPTAYYNDPTLLWNAQPLQVTHQIIGNQLILDPATNFLGTFTVTVTATDVLGKSSQRTFTVTVG